MANAHAIVFFSRTSASYVCQDAKLKAEEDTRARTWRSRAGSSTLILIKP